MESLESLADNFFQFGASKGSRKKCGTYAEIGCKRLKNAHPPPILQMQQKTTNANAMYFETPTSIVKTRGMLSLNIFDFFMYEVN